MHSRIIIIDFGSPYTQLIARKVRDLNVYCDIYPYHNVLAIDDAIKGIILAECSLGLDSQEIPNIDLHALKGKTPILGLNSGAMHLLKLYGGSTSAQASISENSSQLLEISPTSELFKGLSGEVQIITANGEPFTTIPNSFSIEAKNSDKHPIAYYSKEHKVSGILAHSSIFNTKIGETLLHNFAVNSCGCKQDWTPKAFVNGSIAQIQEEVGNDRVILGLSGGVDSSVAAILIHKAIGKNLTCIFVDNGLLRKNEFQEVLESYQSMGLNIMPIDAKQQFYDNLKGVSDPEEKRKIIGRTFIEVFDKAAQSAQGAQWLAQGTIYPDVIESVSVKGSSVSIKSHHNVGGLPEKMNLKILEPLRFLFKDEVRRVGAELGLASNILNRHPFPGPGLGIRILGNITPEKVAILQQADYIYTQALREHQLYEKIWQAGAILLPVQTVGVENHKRTYEYVVALRAVTSVDGMTADWYPLPHEFLKKVSNDIIHNTIGVNRVVYDISSKPPATIEWE